MGDEAVDGFPLEWEDLADAARSWRLSTWTEHRPVPMLEREFLVQIGAAQRRCHDETGWSFGLSEVRFPNGFCYMAVIDEPESAIAERRERFARHARELVSLGTDLWEAEVRPLLEARLADLRRTRRARDLGAMVVRLEEAIDVAADAMGNLHWRMADRSPFDWSATYRDLTGGTAQEAVLLLSGLGHRTARLVGRLRSLARDAQAEPELIDAVSGGDVDRVRELSPRFHRRFQRLLADYGRRTGYGAGSSVTFSTPTWAMRPALVLAIIAGYARADLDAIEENERRARAARVGLARRVRRQLRDDRSRLASFEAAYDRAVRRVRMSEDSNHLIEQETIGTMREAINDIARHLVAAGVLGHPDDVLHLSVTDLHAVAVDPVAASDARELVRSRATELNRQSRLVPPRVLGTAPANATFAAPAPTPRRPGATPVPEEIRGVGVAPGRADGRARVVPMSAEPPDVGPGDVLIARDAGPAWTPVLPLVAAVILDRGALNDHAAIMARDLGIPAVMHTEFATKWITDGSHVVVDGTAGTVRHRS